jgi:HK97 family phage portal protein
MFVSNGSLVTTKTPLNISNGSSYWPSIPPMSGGWPSAYGGIYERQLWVYVVVSKRAKATARLPLKVYEHDDLNRPTRDDHPLAKLLKNPNPAMSGFDLWLWTSSIFDIYGEAFLFKRRVPGPVGVELYPFHPTSMSWDEDTSTWTFNNDTKRIDGIKPLDVVHFRDFHPTSTRCGLSPLEPLRATLENEWSARTAISSFWQRGARPGTYITHPRNISQAAQTRLKAQFNEVAAGSANTGTTILLEEGMEPKPLMLTAEEAQYIETRKLNREEVCAAYDIPPPVVHILDHATFSNITEQMRSMYRDTMAPHLQGFEATIERDLRRVEWPSDNVYAEFLMDDVLRGDFETRAAALSQAEWMTLAEKRKVENLPYIEGTDRIFMNSADVPMPMPTSGDAPAAPPFATVGLPALIAAGVITEQDARDLLAIPGTAPGVVAEPAPVKFVLSEKDARIVTGRLSWQDDLLDVDPRYLVKNLNGSTPTVLYALNAEVADGGSIESLRERIRALVKE